MSAISLNQSTLTAVKRGLQSHFKNIQSSHITEALASGLGFQTHAALLAFVASRGDFPEFRCFLPENFERRLAELSDVGISRSRVQDSQRYLASKGIVDPGVRPIVDSRYSLKPATARQALRDQLLTAVVNEGIEKKLFSLVPSDNRWNAVTGSDGGIDFPVSIGRFWGEAHVSDAGFGELNLSVRVYETQDLDRIVPTRFGLIRRGAIAQVSSWLEREDGHWIQDSKHDTYLSRKHTDELLSFRPTPRGFASRGSFRM